MPRTPSRLRRQFPDHIGDPVPDRRCQLDHPPASTWPLAAPPLRPQPCHHPTGRRFSITRSSRWRPGSSARASVGHPTKAVGEAARDLACAGCPSAGAGVEALEGARWADSRPAHGALRLARTPASAAWPQAAPRPAWRSAAPVRPGRAPDRPRASMIDSAPSMVDSRNVLNRWITR